MGLMLGGGDYFFVVTITISIISIPVASITTVTSMKQLKNCKAMIHLED